jgi:class 3 adenylate cyclase
MTLLTFRSIRSRLMGASTALIVVILSAVVLLSTMSERELIREAKTQKVQALARGTVLALGGEIEDQNWTMIRFELSDILASSDDAVYAFVTDRQRGDEIIASEPQDQLWRMVPDLVPLELSQAALDRPGETRIAYSFLLRDAEYPAGVLRARRGEPIVEISTSLGADRERRAKGSLRIGISLKDVERATTRAVERAAAVGIVAILLGWLGSYVVARRLTDPIVALEASADRIARGDLTHRAGARGEDEIAALARAFNSMTSSLQASFDQLTATTRSFERFVPRKFLQVIAPEGIEKIDVGKYAERTITILFSDIRGYTTLSEGYSPMQVFDMLNVYLARVGHPIADHGGFIDKYIGDAVMALFDDDSTDGALDAALAMRAALAAYNEDRAAEGSPPIDTGIGLHRGEVIMGTVGFTVKIDSTVIGDAVNVASRVEGLTKTYGCAILVTQSVVDAIAEPAKYALRLVDGNATVKGKGQSLAIYELTPKLTG